MKLFTIVTLTSLFSASIAFTKPISNTPSFVTKRNSMTELNESKKPVCVVVEAEIQPDRIDEFLELILKDAEGSRKEAGCQRFGM